MPHVEVVLAVDREDASTVHRYLADQGAGARVNDVRLVAISGSDVDQAILRYGEASAGRILPVGEGAALIAPYDLVHRQGGHIGGNHIVVNGDGCLNLGRRGILIAVGSAARLVCVNRD